MDLETQLLAVLAATLAVATGLAWRQRNAGRDVALLGGLGGLLGAGAALSALF